MPRRAGGFRVRRVRVRVRRRAEPSPPPADAGHGARLRLGTGPGPGAAGLGPGAAWHGRPEFRSVVLLGPSPGPGPPAVTWTVVTSGLGSRTRKSNDQVMLRSTEYLGPAGGPGTVGQWLKAAPAVTPSRPAGFESASESDYWARPRSAPGGRNLTLLHDV